MPRNFKTRLFLLYIERMIYGSSLQVIKIVKPKGDNQMTKPLTVAALQKMKREGQKIVMMTAYDYPTTQICEQAGADILLVGDSLGNVVLGYPSTTPVTMDEMIHHIKPVARTAKRALVVGDMPFGSYHCGIEAALQNGVRLIKEGGCAALKLEGGKEFAPLVREFTDRGLPVMAHIGLLPQTASMWQGYRFQGRNQAEAELLLESALALEEAGAFAVVMECVASEAAEYISKKLTIPTIGIGSGVSCDGQVLVFHDTVGINQGHTPKFVKQYANAAALMQEAIQNYAEEVRGGLYPTAEHSFPMDADQVAKLK